MDKVVQEYDRFLVNPYRDWAQAQGIPIHEGFAVDLLSVETAPWDFSGGHGALVHLDGRGDYAAIFLHDIQEGGKLSRLQNCFEEIFYVLEGNGTATVTDARGKENSFEWGPHSLFSIPLNSPYRLFNASGAKRAKVASTNNLPMTLKLYHNHDFVFNNPFRFPDREGPREFYEGGGVLKKRAPGKHTWETNFIPDVRELELQAWKERGGGSTNVMLIMADGTMHAHVSEMPVGTYKKAHRHGPDFHVFCVRGEGFSQFWYEGQEGDMGRVDWEHGWVFAPANQQYHLHFNKGSQPCRYMATALGSRRYPFNDRKEVAYSNVHNVKKVGELSYEEQPARCHLDFLIEIGKRDVASKMDQFLEEGPYLAELERLNALGA